MQRLTAIAAIALVSLVTRSPESGRASGDEKAARPAALVPAYFYPAGKGLKAWRQLAADARTIRVEVILDPADGPGRKRDPAYVTVLSNFRKAGGRVLGYITTSYAKREIALVERDLRSYLDFYEVDGVFLDEMTGTKEALPYYQKVRRLIKEIKPAFKIVGNPGQPFIDEGYIETVDVLVLFEGTADEYLKYNPRVSTPWMNRYPASCFANIVHTLSTPEGMRQAIAKAGQDQAGWVFITDRKMPNPYDDLPEYWAEEISGFERANAGGLEDSTQRRGISRCNRPRNEEFGPGSQPKA